MFRKFVAVSLAVSLIAMASSGMMMFMVDRPSFTLQLHPVHKLFGLLMVAAAVSHLILNFKGLKNHLKNRAVAVTGVALSLILALLYGIALNSPVPTQSARQLDELARQLEAQERGNHRAGEPSKLRKNPSGQSPGINLAYAGLR